MASPSFTTESKTREIAKVSIRESSYKEVQNLVSPKNFRSKKFWRKIYDIKLHTELYHIVLIIG